MGIEESRISGTSSLQDYNRSPMLSCDICGDEYKGKKSYGDPYKCDSCNKISYYLLNYDVLDIPKMPDTMKNLLLRVTYDIEKKPYHNGYCSCSDSGDVKVRKKGETFEYPVSTMFENKHIDKKGNILNLKSGLILLYELSEPFPHDSDCCGYDVNYTIVSAKIIKDEIIDLGK